MYRIQYTKSAHVPGNIPDSCWIDGSRHRLLRRAAEAARKATIDTDQPRSWANNMRIVDDETGNVIPWETWEPYLSEHACPECGKPNGLLIDGGPVYGHAICCAACLSERSE